MVWAVGAVHVNAKVSGFCEWDFRGRISVGGIGEGGKVEVVLDRAGPSRAVLE